MNTPRVHEGTDFSVTSEQINRLERSLLSFRRSPLGSPEALEAIAAVQYQEILRLRAELDTAMGFEQQLCDLMVSLRGPTIGFGVAPASVIAGFLNNIRAAMQTVTAYLKTGETLGQRPAASKRNATFGLSIRRCHKRESSVEAQPTRTPDPLSRI